jgi:cytochrome c556
MRKNYSIILYSILSILISTGAAAADEKKDTRTPEEKAYQFRDGLFHVIEFKFGKMIEAKFADDKLAFHKIAAEISYLSKMIPEGFIPNSIVEGTQAKKEIWEDWKKFTKKAAKFQKNLDGLADPTYDFTSFDPKKFGGDNCGSCHRKFKSREKFKK